MGEGIKRHFSVNRVLMGLLIVVIFFDAWGTWQNNRILRGRDALFNELRREHADLKELCR